jgi:protein-S-isoprenylcysteine O-methyltransferase Ste14
MSALMLKLLPAIWALAYLLITAAAGYLLGWPLIPGLPADWLSIVLILVGIALAVAAVTLLRREGAEVDSMLAANRKLVTTGPFALTRNPVYLGLVLVTVNIALWAGAWPMLVPPLALFATANWIHIPFEEETMRRQYGEAFDAYARQVRRWL